MRRRVLLLILLAVALSGCRVETTLDVGLDNDGSGNVEVEARLDKEAAAAAPDLARQLRVDDLKARGWDVEGPRKEGDQTVVTASHPFANVEEANALLTHVGPASGPIQGFRLSQERSLTRVDSNFRGTVDLTKGVEAWGDPVLAQRVGNGLGFDPAEMQRGTETNLQDAFTFNVAVHLPGSSRFDPALPSGAQSWAAPYGRASVYEAESSGLNLEALGYVALAVLVVLAAVALTLFWKPYAPRHRQSMSERMATAREKGQRSEGKGGERFR